MPSYVLSNRLKEFSSSVFFSLLPSAVGRRGKCGIYGPYYKPGMHWNNVTRFSFQVCLYNNKSVLFTVIATFCVCGHSTVRYYVHKPKVHMAPVFVRLQ